MIVAPSNYNTYLFIILLEDAKIDDHLQKSLQLNKIECWLNHENLSQLKAGPQETEETAVEVSGAVPNQLLQPALHSGTKQGMQAIKNLVHMCDWINILKISP